MPGTTFREIMEGIQLLHEDVWRIKDLPQFRDEDVAVLNGFAFAFEEKTYRPDDVICQHGLCLLARSDDDAYVHWILSGEATCFTDPAFDFHHARGIQNTSGEVCTKCTTSLSKVILKSDTKCGYHASLSVSFLK
eukprot:scaffold360478_cov38-Prasinocladus_malaysianus.AAC.1